MDINIYQSDLFCLCAGAIDAAVGGGGLIQIPALMNAFPSMAPATLFDTNPNNGNGGVHFFPPFPLPKSAL